jgi:hypothetical protein
MTPFGMLMNSQAALALIGAREYDLLSDRG